MKLLLTLLLGINLFAFADESDEDWSPVDSSEEIYEETSEEDSSTSHDEEPMEDM